MANTSAPVALLTGTADPGLTATDLSGGQGHPVHYGTGAIIAYALAAPGGPTGTFADRDGTVPW